MSGKVRLVDDGLEIDSAEIEVRDHVVDATDQKLLQTGTSVSAGQKLTTGVKDPHDILRIEGMEATQRYLLEQVQTVYRNQGVSINDKHIETIVRQMLRWVRVDSTGDTDLLPNQLIDRLQFHEANTRTMAEGGEPATSKPEILGVTRASLNTDSFLAKASFQETARVLTEAAILGEVDYLRGLKENVIIGRLIPARLDLSEEGRELLGIAEVDSHHLNDDDARSDRDLLSLMADYPGADASDRDDDFASLGPLDINFDEDDADDEDDDIDDDLSDDVVDSADQLVADAPHAEATGEEEAEEAVSDDEEPDESALASVLGDSDDPTDPDVATSVEEV